MENRSASCRNETPGNGKANAEYRTIIQASMDGFWKIGADGRILDCNESACAMLGYSRNEMLTMSLHDVDLIEDETLAGEHVRLVAAKGFDRFETKHRRKDGSGIDVEVSAYCLPGAEAPLLFAFSRDISARKAAEKALRESEERYRAVVEDQTELIACFRPDGTLTFVNSVACHKAGKTAAELIGQRWPTLVHPDDLQPLVHPDDLPMIDARLSELALNNPQVMLEIRFRSDDGQLDWIQFACRAIFDGTGKVAQIQSVGRDISERKKTELALQKMQFFKQAILDAVSAQVAVLDKRGVIIEVNEAWCRFALENARIPALNCCNVDVGTDYLDTCRSASGLNDDGAQEAARGIQAVLDGSIPKYEQEYSCHSPRAQRWFLMTVTPLSQEQGGAVIAHHDISAPRLLAEELRQSEARTRSILRTAPVGIGVLVDRAFVEVNETFALMTGYTIGELIGSSAQMLYPTQADFDYVGSEKYRQIRENGIGNVESRFKTKDGRIINVALSSAPIVPADLSRGVTFAVQDITAIKHSEQLRFSLEARQRDALVREVHHRIKNHLQGVLGLMRNTIIRHPELAGPMEAIVTRVLAISQVYGLQGSNPDARVEICNLIDAALSAAISMVPVQYRRLSNEMEALLAPDEAVPIAMVINELLTNAIKHLDSSAVEPTVQIVSLIERDKVRIVVKNAPASLPPGFDFSSGKGTGTGLELLKALLPRKGASLHFCQEGDAVTAELELEAPIVSSPMAAAAAYA